MKQIKENVYENLTSEQRVIAAVEALARKDEAELKRLKDTCPQYTYRMTDPAYSDAMLELFTLAVAIYSGMKDAIIIGLLAHLSKQDEGLFIGLQKLANVDALWTTYLDSKGISRKSMDIVTKDLTHDYIRLFLEHCPEPDMDRVDAMYESMKGLNS